MGNKENVDAEFGLKSFKREENTDSFNGNGNYYFYGFKNWFK